MTGAGESSGSLEPGMSLSYSCFLRLRFFICKMGVAAHPSLQGMVEIKFCVLFKLPSARAWHQVDTQEI